MSAPATTELHVEGMTCNHCALRVTEAAQKVPGVRGVSVNVQNAHATVRWNSDSEKNLPGLLRAISQAGYDAAEQAVDTAVQESRWQWNLILGLSVTAVLMLGEWAFGLAMKPWFHWFAFVLAGIVQAFCGAEFYAGAWRQLKAGQSNMDTLVALGSSTAFGYSTWALLSGTGGHLYFMEAAAIISLVSAGHWMEARVSERASGALKSLLNLAPQTARRLAPHSGDFPRGNGKTGLKSFNFSQATGGPQPEMETEVPVSALQIDDRVALRPGDRVPVDGVVIEGESAVDESMLTGESNPADKKSGSELFAGTVNVNGRMVMRVTALGENTALAHIVAAVQRAQTSRADIQRLGDRVSNIFVPVIVMIAVAAGLWWGLAPQSAARAHDFLAHIFWHVHAPAGAAAGFIIAAAVLIIACPCAMGLATPAAIMAAANAAAKRGILVRDGVALEKAGAITAVVFDKTGTLTEGKPVVSEVWQNGPDGVDRLAIAVQLARHSTHPASGAVGDYARRLVPTHPQDQAMGSDWREIRGAGVEAEIDSAVFRLGSLRWLRESSVDAAAGDQFIKDWSARGATIVGLSADKELLALFALYDAVKPHSKEVVARLQQQMLKTYLLTGDNAQTAGAIAQQSGILPENVFSEVRPGQKAEFIKKLQSQGESVAFVGDGINDAPALSQADLGIAVSRASDVAREAADIILLKSDVETVPEAIGLARATLRTIKQNLFWAFFYNALGVPLAALGFISPIFCAAAMGVSDLVVIGNALRLLRWKQSK